MRTKPKYEEQIGSNMPTKSSIGKKTAEYLKSKGFKCPLLDNLVLIKPGLQMQNNSDLSDSEFRVKMIKKYKLI